MEQAKEHILSILHTLTESISSAPDAQFLCDALFKVVDDFVEVHYSAIYLWDFQEGRFKLYNTKGFSEEERISSEKTALDRHPGWVFKHRKALHIPDMSAENIPNYVQSSDRTFHVQSRLWVPITTKNRSLGAFGFASTEKNFFTEEHIKVLELLCRLAGNIYASIVFAEAEKKYTESMKLSLVKIEEANNAQQNFIAKMSHEMRTPLNGIIGVSKLLEESNQLSADQREYINVISVQSSILLNLINDVLDISKIQTEGFSLVEFPFNLKNVTEKLVAAVKIQAYQKNIAFEWFYDALIEDYVIGDELRYSQILTNLLNNALKFTKEGSLRMKIALENKEASKQNLTIQIIDTGIGIAQDKLTDIFERFKQADNSISRSYGGSGLGLYITREIVVKMGGTIQVKSELGRGTEFTVHLPLVLDKERKKKELNSGIVDIHGVRILLAEDNPVNVFYIKSVLTKRGAQVEVVNDGKAAIESCRNATYDLILMDLQMPVMDGLTASSIIRKELKIKTPIIAQSANTVENQIQECYELGINDYLAKPFKAEHLIAKIASHLYLTTEVEPSKKYREEKKESVQQTVLALAGGDPNLAAEMLEVFQNETPMQLDLLSHYWKAGDLQQVNQLGHKLKSTFQYFEMPEAAELSSYFEYLASFEVKQNEANQKLYKLDQFLQNTIKEIQESR